MREACENRFTVIARCIVDQYSHHKLFHVKNCILILKIDASSQSFQLINIINATQILQQLSSLHAFPISYFIKFSRSYKLNLSEFLKTSNRPRGTYLALMRSNYYRIV